MKKIKLIAIISVAVVALIGVGVGGYFIFRPKDPSNTETNNKVYYYSNLHQAVTAVESEDYENAALIVSEENAGVSVVVNEGLATISLLKNEELEETLVLKKDVIINLNGKEITSACQVAIKVESGNIVFDGTTEGGKVKVSNDDSLVTALHIVSGSCKINGGSYETTSNSVATTENPNISLLCESGSIDIENSSITAKDRDKGVLYGVTIGSNATCNMKNTSVEVDSPYGLNSYGVKNDGTMTMLDCIVNAYANYTANEARTDYASTSRAVFNTGTAILKNCTMYGTHSGVTSKGVLYIDGGTYEGYGHGGFYLSSEAKTSYFKNATFKDCEMRNDYIDDGVAGTNRSGGYIGGASNVTLYIDNCDFSGDMYPFVMRSSGYRVDGVKYYESNISVYVSNSTIDFDRTSFRGVRVDASAEANQKLYIGVGNNFTAQNGPYGDKSKANAVDTEENYSAMFPEF